MVLGRQNPGMVVYEKNVIIGFHLSQLVLGAACVHTLKLSRGPENKRAKRVNLSGPLLSDPHRIARVCEPAKYLTIVPQQADSYQPTKHIGPFQTRDYPFKFQVGARIGVPKQGLLILMCMIIHVHVG